MKLRATWQKKMGVPQVWELLRPYIKDKRVPLKCFVSDFKRSNGRSPRIAIDGYSWIFECGFLVNQDASNKYAGYGTIPKALVNFLHRLKEFLSLDISFVLVFDGSMKPWFKNNYKNSGEETTTDTEHIEEYSVMWAEHMKAHQLLHTCLETDAKNSTPSFMKIIKYILDEMRISYVEACGEGEAQCAWLQKHKYVDFVLSNDSDTLIFGCTKMLRNYSKSWEDVGATGIGNHRPDRKRDNKESFVTVVNVDEIGACANERYNWWSLLFFSVLLGADYNKGVQGLGKSKSAKLAQLTSPDFAMEFHDIFTTTESSSKRRVIEYEQFKKRLYDYCKSHSVELFGRNYKTLLQEDMHGWPSDTAIMYYFHPFLIPDLDEDVMNLRNVNMSGSPGYEDIEFTNLKNYLSAFHLPGVTDFEKWFFEMMQESFVLRHLLINDKGSEECVRITEEKVLYFSENRFQTSCWKVRYNPFIESLSKLSCRPTSKKASSPRKRSPTKRQLESEEYWYSAWIPKELIPSSHILVKGFEERRKNEEMKQQSRTKSSPKKTLKASQKNTLDEFLMCHSSPIKNINNLSTIKIPLLEPVKKRLFVEQDDFEELSEHEDSSLIILEEVDISNNASSPSKQIWDLTQDYEKNHSDIEESPIKKQRLHETADLH